MGERILKAEPYGSQTAAVTTGQGGISGSVRILSLRPLMETSRLEQNLPTSLTGKPYYKPVHTLSFHVSACPDLSESP